MRVISFPLINGSEEVYSTKKCLDKVMQVAWLPDSKNLLTVSGGAVQLWRVDGTRATRFYRSDGRRVSALAVSPDNEYLAMVVWMGGASQTLSEHIEVREVATGRIMITYRGHKRGIEDLAWSPDGQWIVSVASGYDDRTAHVWHAITGEQQRVYAAQEQGIRCIDISPDSHYAVTGGSGPLAHIWNIATGETVQVFNLYDGITRVAFSPDGTRIAIGGISAYVCVWPHDRP